MWRVNIALALMRTLREQFPTTERLVIEADETGWPTSAAWSVGQAHFRYNVPHIPRDVVFAGEHSQHELLRFCNAVRLTVDGRTVDDINRALGCSYLTESK